MSDNKGSHSKKNSNGIGLTIKEKKANPEKTNVIKQEIKTIPLREIIADTSHTVDEAKVFAIKNLISSKGLLQPVVVLRRIDKKYQLRDGFHRYYACKELGIRSIDCFVVDDIGEYKILTLELNLLQIKMLSPLEKAQLAVSLRNSIDENGKRYTVTKICEILSISRKPFYRLAHLLELNKGLQHYVDINLISINSVETISKHLSAHQQTVLEKYVDKTNNRLSIKDIERIAALSNSSDPFTIRGIQTIISVD